MLIPRIGTPIFGRYVLRREIARGGTGSVWVAEDKRLRRPVAVKLLMPRAGSSTSMRARFEREAMAVAQLNSPHVVQIYDYGIEGDSPFIVMELLRGEDLRVRLARVGRLTLDEAALVVVHTSKALEEAHAAGIVHRDLKPGNLFLQQSRDEEIVKVLDFGIAKTMAVDLEHESTEEGEIVGTPQYMSPEQAQGADDVDHRSDLWSLGVILYRALTGRLPFKGRSAPDTLLRICHATPEPATLVLPELPAEVDGFFARALAREPSQRFASVGAMAEAFLSIAAQTSLAGAAPSLSGLAFGGLAARSRLTPAPPSSRSSEVGRAHGGPESPPIADSSEETTATELKTIDLRGTLPSTTPQPMAGIAARVSSREPARGRAWRWAAALAALLVGVVLLLQLQLEVEPASVVIGEAPAAPAGENMAEARPTPAAVPSSAAVEAPSRAPAATSSLSEPSAASAVAPPQSAAWPAPRPHHDPALLAAPTAEHAPSGGVSPGGAPSSAKVPSQAPTSTPAPVDAPVGASTRAPAVVDRPATDPFAERL